jgi:hypothetical protein
MPISETALLLAIAEQQLPKALVSNTPFRLWPGLVVPPLIQIELIPTCIDQNLRVHCRRPMVMMRQG